MMHTLLEQMGSGLLSESVHALKGKLEQLLGDSQATFAELRRRVRILSAGQRVSAGPSFAAVARAVVERKQLEVRYWARTTDENTSRVISPQRLVHYRGNWYVDAWCHLRKAVRNFAVDGIREINVLPLACKELTEAELDDSLGANYGVFTGGRRRWATLRFSAERSRWIRDEVWHPAQTMRIGRDGRVTLKVPYAQPLELAMDTLRHAGHVEILEPAELRDAVLAAARELVVAHPQP